MAHDQERAIFHLFLIHSVERLLSDALGLEADESLAGQGALIIALDAGGLDFSKLVKHSREFLVVGADG